MGKGVVARSEAVEEWRWRGVEVARSEAVEEWRWVGKSREKGYEGTDVMSTS